MTIAAVSTVPAIHTRLMINFLFQSMRMRERGWSSADPWVFCAGINLSRPSELAVCQHFVAAALEHGKYQKRIHAAAVELRANPASSSGNPKRVLFRSLRIHGKQYGFFGPDQPCTFPRIHQKSD